MLDSPPDPDFDHLTAMAALVMKTPVALVTLLEIDRQWFKSRHGVDFTETPTEISFCAHTIAADGDIMEILDPTTDRRFADNPLVTGEQSVRYYAGAPIMLGGEKIGTLCVLDRAVHAPLDPSQAEQLKALAALASSLFALKENERKGSIAKAQLVFAEKRHALALDAAHIASWVWDIRSETVECDALLPILFNLPHATRLDARDFYAAVDRRDIAKFEAGLQAVLTDSDEYSSEYRVKGVEPTRWLASRGKVLERDAEGRALLVFGVNFDITERRTAEERQRLLLLEINHRVKNTLATVQALATQTVRHSSEPRAFLDAFNGRLHSLGLAHGLLSDHEWQGIRLMELVRQQIKPFDDPDAPRVRTNGLDVYLTPDQALALGLILHELASNALKYGSLSVASGLVELSWQIEQAATEEGARRLSMQWLEMGGPEVKPPDQQGFGSILIKRSLDKVLSSTVLHEFLRDGVRAQISLPLEAVSP